MDNGDSHHDQNIELEGNDALDIHEDAPIIAYLQTCEIPVGFTSKEQNCVVHRSKRSDGKVIPYYECGQMDEYE